MEETVEVVMASMGSGARAAGGGDHGVSAAQTYILNQSVPQIVSRINANRTPDCIADSVCPDFIEQMEGQMEYKVAVVLWQVGPAVLFLFGTFGNVLILMMLRTLRLGRTSMHIYLRALAISDLCVLYTGLLRWWLYWTFNVDIRDLHAILCKGHLWLVYASLSVSAWLLVVMTLERTCSACLPHRVNTFCTKRRACFLIVFLVVFHSLIQSHFLVGMTVVERENGTFRCMEVSERYKYFVHEIWPLVDLCILSLLPFICLIVGNAIIVWKTFLSLKTAAELNLTSSTNAMIRRRHASSMTVILLGLSALFLLTTSPTCAYNMWERGGAAATAGRTPVGRARLELVWASVNIVMYCNNTFNFYLYCLTGRKFRHEMRRHFSRRRTESQSNVLSAPSLQVHRFPMSDCKKNGGSPENGQVSSYSPGRVSLRGRTSNAYL